MVTPLPDGRYKVDGRKMYWFRRELGMNQREFSTLVGVKKHCVQQWEAGTVLVCPGTVGLRLLELMEQEETEGGG